MITKYELGAVSYSKEIVQYISGYAEEPRTEFRFEDLTAAAMKGYMLWDITPCSRMKVNRRSEEHIASSFMVEE
jgi:hypothetical protein